MPAARFTTHQNRPPSGSHTRALIATAVGVFFCLSLIGCKGSKQLIDEGAGRVQEQAAAITLDASGIIGDCGNIRDNLTAAQATPDVNAITLAYIAKALAATDDIQDKATDITIRATTVQQAATGIREQLPGVADVESGWHHWLRLALFTAIGGGALYLLFLTGIFPLAWQLLRTGLSAFWCIVKSCLSRLKPVLAKIAAYHPWDHAEAIAAKRDAKVEPTPGVAP